MKATSSARGGSLLITNNTVAGLRTAMFSGKYLDDVIITKNTVTSLTATPSVIVNVTNSNDVIVVGNTLPSGASISQPVVTTNSTNLVQASNSWD